MAQKGKIRSIRISNQMAELIDQQVGSNFTEKWENLVTRCVWELPQAEQRLQDIKKEIQEEKDKLHQLLGYIKTLAPDVEGRAFCDTAPLLERYWAVRAGLGFMGRNRTLIIPGKGSYFFLGVLAVTAPSPLPSALTGNSSGKLPGALW